MAGSSKKSLMVVLWEAAVVVRGRERLSLWGGAYIFVIEAIFAKEAEVFSRTEEPVPI